MAPQNGLPRTCPRQPALAFDLASQGSRLTHACSRHVTYLWLASALKDTPRCTEHSQSTAME